MEKITEPPEKVTQPPEDAPAPPSPPPRPPPRVMMVQVENVTHEKFQITEEVKVSGWPSDIILQ